MLKGFFLFWYTYSEKGANGIVVAHHVINVAGKIVAGKYCLLS